MYAEGGGGVHILSPSVVRVGSSHTLPRNNY